MKTRASTGSAGWKPGLYEAQLVKVESKQNGDLAYGGRFYFRAISPPPGAKYNLCYYTLPVDHEKNKPSDCGFSLKMVLYFLQHDIESGIKISNVRHLIGRYVNLVIKARYIKGRMIPIICGFQFNTFQLFRINGSYHMLESNNAVA
jgi:hypothetical protein